MEQADITDREILDLWDALSGDGREWFLDTAQRRMEARLAEPARPDDVESLTRRLTGMSPDEVRVIGQTGDDIIEFSDGTRRHLFDLQPGPEQRAFRRYVDDQTRRLYGPGPDEPHAAAEPPEHRAARQRTDEEQAALTPPARVGRWVVGQGWVPVDDGGPLKRSAR
jgi:hypothetical protein